MAFYRFVRVADDIGDSPDLPAEEKLRRLDAMERGLDDPALAAARAAVEQILQAHEPFPALAVDRHWNLVSHNTTAGALLAMGVAPDLLEPPVNVLRLSLDPRGLAPRILNFREWRAHVLARLSQQVDDTADPVLNELHEELASSPVPAGAKPWRPHAASHHGGIAVPLVLSSGVGVLSFISTTTVFGTALDVSLSELAIESFFPADEETARILIGGRNGQPAT